MKKLIIPIACICFFLAGCPAPDSGDVEAAKAASQQAPKSVEQLPPDMPEEAKRSAAGAIQAGKDREAQMNAQADARARAMAEMERQRGR